MKDFLYLKLCTKELYTLMFNPLSMASFSQNMLLGFEQISTSLFKDATVLWLLVPILLFWVILEIYFDRYKKEELGWNTALGNGLSVFWIIIVCLKFLFQQQKFLWDKFLAIFLIFLYSILVIINSFSHKLRKRWSFLLAGPTPVYFLSAVAVLWTYGALVITRWVLLDLFVIYILLVIIGLILKKVIPPAPAEESDISSTESLPSGGGFKEFRR